MRAVAAGQRFGYGACATKRIIVKVYIFVHNVHMEPMSDNPNSAATRLGMYIREARKQKRCTINDMAAKLGRPREWLNRIELGYSQQGEYKPPSASDVQAIIDLLGSDLTVSAAELQQLQRQAEDDFNQARRPNSHVRPSVGKLTQTEVIMGQKQIVQAITGLINEQYADAVIRNTGIKGPGSYVHVDDDWKQYRLALGQFLSKNPNALFKRVEYADTAKHVDEAKEADSKVAGSREPAEVHNAKIKFYKHNPLQMHVLIGQREAILALPQTSGQAGSNIALLIRDKIFVEALRVWYDEILWDAPDDSRNIDFQNFDSSFDEVKKFYGF